MSLVADEQLIIGMVGYTYVTIDKSHWLNPT
jgi:hypothetical protein